MTNLLDIGRAIQDDLVLSFPDVQLHIGDAPLGAGPESILPMVVMDSGLATSSRPGMTEKETCGATYRLFGSNRFSSPFQQSA